MRKIVVLAMLALVVPALAGQLNAVSPTSVAPLTVGGARALTGNIVYDNTTNGQPYYFNQTGTEVGDDISFAGGQTGNLQAFTFIYYDPSPAATTANVFFYEQDLVTGEVGNYLGGYTIENLPGVGAWIINVDPVDYPITFDQPDIWMSVQFDDANSGLILYTPPTVGTSYDVFAQFTGTWSYYYFTGHNPAANFGLAVSLTPEPASLALLALGALTLIRRR